MSTSAAVYVESLDRTVRVNSDGYPEYMVPALEYFEGAGLIEDFAGQDEYYAVVADVETFERYQGYGFRDRGYIQVQGVGWAFTDPIRLRTHIVNGEPQFSQRENHSYVLKANGTVVVVH